MKVLLLNGSRRKEGCTYTALCEVAQVLEQEGVETEILFAGDPSDEAVAAAAEAMKTADGLVVGSPVYWASPSGEIVTFLDKFAAKAGASLAHKPAAAVASARRAGTTATLDVLHKYFEYFEMPLVASCYWPMVHGNTPEEVHRGRARGRRGTARGRDAEKAHELHPLTREVAVCSGKSSRASRRRRAWGAGTSPSTGASAPARR